MSEKGGPANGQPGGAPEAEAASPQLSVIEKALGHLQKAPDAGDRPIIIFFGNVTIISNPPAQPPPSPPQPPPGPGPSTPPSWPWWQVSLLTGAIAAVLAFVMVILATDLSLRIAGATAILVGAAVFAVTARMDPASRMRRTFWSAIVLTVGVAALGSYGIEGQVGDVALGFNVVDDWPILVLLTVIVLVAGGLAWKEMDMGK